jgi:tRNA dimethylallyltransferase
MTERPLVVCLMGPTCTGKTRAAVTLVERFPFEIVSVDSAMVYRGMDIGTAKPDAPTLARAPHRLIDIRDPGERYSAAEFRGDALDAIEEILAAGRTPLLVGGTGLYYRALLRGLSRLPSADPRLRAEIDAQAADVGWSAMHARLERLDPASAARIHTNDSQRIQRALEICELAGRPMSDLLAQRRDEEGAYRFVKIVLCPPRPSIHKQIEERFRAMLDAGLIDEVMRLRARGDLTLELPSMRMVGYRQVWQCLDGEFPREELERRGIFATRQLAKRQITWFRTEPETIWIGEDYRNQERRLLQTVVDNPIFH